MHYNPNDRKNLNRVFPGDPEGTICQRAAHPPANKGEPLFEVGAVADKKSGES